MLKKIILVSSLLLSFNSFAEDYRLRLAKDLTGRKMTKLIGPTNAAMTYINFKITFQAGCRAIIEVERSLQNSELHKTRYEFNFKYISQYSLSGKEYIMTAKNNLNLVLKNKWIDGVQTETNETINTVVLDAKSEEFTAMDFMELDSGIRRLKFFCDRL